jgi:hypothetical protein
MLRKNLRKLVTATILIIATLFLFMPMQKVEAVLRERYYTVYDECLYGPKIPGPIGEWYVDCYGNWDGWGARPNEYPCAYI